MFFLYPIRQELNQVDSTGKAHEDEWHFGTSASAKGEK
jgi:hypothetical protein